MFWSNHADALKLESVYQWCCTVVVEYSTHVILESRFSISSYEVQNTIDFPQEDTVLGIGEPVYLLLPDLCTTEPLILSAVI